MKRVTRDQVASSAGVSTATVSRVFNGLSNVAPQTADAVREAADRLGYIPNKHASALSRPGGATILMLEAHSRFRKGQWLNLSWVWAESVRAVRDVVNETMHSLELRSYHNGDHLRRILDSGQWAGIILNFISQPDLLDLAASSGVPYVYCGKDVVPEAYNCCASDETEGGRLAAKELRSTGHRQPFFVGLDHGGNDYVFSRYEGFASLYPDATRRLYRQSSSVGQAIAVDIATGVRRGEIDSLFLVNSVVAIDVFYNLQALGIRVPEDLSLITYDRSPLLEGLPLDVTTIDTRFTDLFTLGVQRLFEIIQSPEPIRELVSPALVRGESVANR